MGRWIVCLLVMLGSAGAQVRRIVPAKARHSATDLEVTGLIPGGKGFVSEAQLASLPQVKTGIDADGNFAADVAKGMQVEGVRLTVLGEALGAAAEVDVIDALCTDQYRAHYPASYLAAHRPILALKVNGMRPKAWAAGMRQYDPGPYFITYEHFVPAFKVLAHVDEAQIPENVVRLNFTTAAADFGPITPPGTYPEDSPEMQGFAIAKQNCLRCHFSGDAGGTKSGRDWAILSLWARQKPEYLTGYVHHPKAMDPKASMPAFPEYDAATLDALVAYFRAFPRGYDPAAGKGGAR